MKTIKVFIASSEELSDERVLLGNLVHTVNRSLKPRGVEVELVEWEYLDDAMGDKPKQEEYNDELLKCDVCIVLCWQKFGKYTKWEFETAYQGHNSDKKMPKKIYIYYKTPGTDTIELQQFKSKIDSYGHFPTHFSHPDTLKLYFVQQLFAFALAQESDLLKVNGTKVELDGQELVNLGNVPCASGNDHYQSLSEDIKNLEKEVLELKEDVEDYKADLAEDPEDERAQRRLRKAESKLMEARQALSDKRKALEELCGNILDTNLKIAQMAGKKTSARLQKAIELFEKGDNKGANAVLDFDEIKAEMAQNAQRIDQARELEQAALEALKSNIEECKLKVKTLETEKRKRWFYKCCKIYDEALRLAEGRIADEEIVDLRFDYAIFLQTNNQYDRTVELYEKNVEWFRKVKAQHGTFSVVGFVKCANSLVGNAMNHILMGQKERAEQEAEEAIAAFRLFVNINDMPLRAYFISMIASLHYNIASLHKEENQYVQSEQEFKEAIGIYRKLMAEYPETYMPKIATNMVELAYLHKEVNQYVQSEQEYKEAISIYRKLAEESPEMYLGEMARTLDGLASLHKEGEQYVQAEQEYKEAITIYRKLIEESPEMYMGELAGCLDSLADIHWTKQKWGQSMREREEVIGIYKGYSSIIYKSMCVLQKKILANYKKQVGITAKHAKTTAENAKALAKRAELSRDVGETYHYYEEAMHYYEESLEIYRKLAMEFPEMYMTEPAGCLVGLAAIHEKMNQFFQSEQEYKEALGICRKLAEQSPEVYLPEHARSLKGLASIHKYQFSAGQEYKDAISAEQEYKEAITIYRKLEEKSPNEYISEIAECLGSLAPLHGEMKQYAEAEQEYKEAILIYRKLMDRFPNKYVELVFCIWGLASSYSSQDNMEMALLTIEEAIKIAPRHSLHRKGKFLLKMGRTDEALAIYHQILEMDADYFKNAESELEKGLKELGRI